MNIKVVKDSSGNVVGSYEEHFNYYDPDISLRPMRIKSDGKDYTVQDEEVTSDYSTNPSAFLKKPQRK